MGNGQWQLAVAVAVAGGSWHRQSVSIHIAAPTTNHPFCISPRLRVPAYRQAGPRPTLRTVICISPRLSVSASNHTNCNLHFSAPLRQNPYGRITSVVSHGVING